MPRTQIRVDTTTDFSVVMKRSTKADKRTLSVLIGNTEIILDLGAAEKLASDVNKLLMSLIFDEDRNVLQTEKEFIDHLLSDVE